MLKIVEGPISLKMSGDPLYFARINDELKYRVENYWRSDAFQLYKRTKGKHGWDGYIRPLTVKGLVATAWRGWLDDILTTCRTLGIEVDGSRLLDRPFKNLVPDDLPDDLLVADFDLDENQRAGVSLWLKHGIGINQVTVSGGKCLGKGTEIMMYSGGVKKVEDVQVGDLLMGPNSTPRTVLSTTSGVSQLYKVEHSDGSSYVCNDAHILVLQKLNVSGRYPNRRYSWSEETMTAEEFFNLPQWKKEFFSGFRVGVNFSENKVDLDPYALGLWLGDGSRHKPLIASGDLEVIEYCRCLAASMGLELREEPGDGCIGLRFSSGNKSPGGNQFTTALRNYGLLGCPEKFIPDAYKFNSEDTRLRILAGLIDSDGCVHAHKTCIAVVEKKLADDCVWLARSLGLRSTMSVRTSKGFGVQTKAYVVSISGTCSRIPTRIARKRMHDTAIKHGLRYGITVSKVEIGDYYGFEIDGDRKFLLGDFTVTHNTAMFCAAASFIKRHYPDARILYLVPTERLVKQAVVNARDFLPDLDIGQWGGGKREFQAEDMVIATGASVGRNYEQLLKDGWFKTFTALFCDESHRVAGPTMQKICQTIPAFFRFGASDSTREDQPGVFADIKAMLGPIRHRVAVDPLIQVGRVAKPSIYYVDIEDWEGQYAHVQHEAQPDTRAWAYIDSGWVKGTYKGPALKIDDDGNIVTMKKKVPVLDEDGKPVYRHGFMIKRVEEVPIQNPGWHLIEDESGGLMEVESRWCLLERTYDKAITRNKDRNDVIGAWAKHFSGQGKQTLIICTRTLHVLILENLIKKLIDPSLVRILFSRHSPKERDESFEWLKQTPGSVLITPLVKEGVSINEIRAGIIADHIVNWEVANQAIGRFLRKKPKGIDNSAEIVWFFDRQHPRMKRNSVQLIERLEKIRGYTYYYPCSYPDVLSHAQRFEAVEIK